MIKNSGEHGLTSYWQERGSEQHNYGFRAKQCDPDAVRVEMLDGKAVGVPIAHRWRVVYSNKLNIIDAVISDNLPEHLAVMLADELSRAMATISVWTAIMGIQEREKQNAEPAA
jgi:hypothetical protein